MSQKETTKMIREIRKLLELNFKSKSISYGEILDSDTIALLKTNLHKLLVLNQLN